MILHKFSPYGFVENTNEMALSLKILSFGKRMMIYHVSLFHSNRVLSKSKK